MQPTQILGLHVNEQQYNGNEIKGRSRMECVISHKNPRALGLRKLISFFLFATERSLDFSSFLENN